MRPLFGPIFLILSGLAITLLTSIDPVHAQDPQPSREPSVYTSQLRQASRLGRSVLRSIQALPEDESIPVDDQLYQNARQTYVLLRAARHGMAAAMERQAAPDPVLGLAFRRVDEAWGLTRVAFDGRTMRRADYVNESVRSLTRAMKLLDQALVMLP